MKLVDYRNFRLNKLNTPEFSHCKLLFFWPVFGILFFLLERGIPFLFGLFGKEITYYPIWCPLDEMIPFCELFIIPYYFWFVFIVGMLIYAFFFEVPTFRKFMWFFIFAYGITGVIYFVFPNMQEFRPLSQEAIGRENILIDIAFLLYRFDTNTNVFPSMHVIGSFAVFFAAWHSELFGKWYWRVPFLLVTVLISISTVFLRQHSILDVFGGLIISFIVYPLVFHREKFFSKKTLPKNAQIREK